MRDPLNIWATWREIHQQPQVWRDWGQLLDVASLRNWIADQHVDEIWLCGAGSGSVNGQTIEIAGGQT